MKKVRKLTGLLLALVMMLSLCVTASADETPSATTGTITISNATIGESYHVYKLFDTTYGNSYKDSEGNTVIPTSYTATEAQKEALEDADGNVFAFTLIEEATYKVEYTQEEKDYTEILTQAQIDELPSGTVITLKKLNNPGSYQVTKRSDATDEEVVAFIKSYVVELSGGVTACNFPGATEATPGDGSFGITDGVATSSTVVIDGLDFGYYFVTSSLGSVISLSTTNPTAEIEDKNTDTPSWDNDNPEPDDPIKTVLDEDAQQDINGQKVSLGETLTYWISYTNNTGETLDLVVITDMIPDGTTYKDRSIGIKFYYTDNGELKQYTATEDVENGGYYIKIGEGDDAITLTYQYDYSEAATDNLTWTIGNLPDGVTLVAEFQVTVNGDALDQGIDIVENDADVKVTLGENDYDLKTNKVKNPIGEDDDPVKDVVKTNDDGSTTDSVDGESVSVGDILTYTITYTYTKEDGGSPTVDLTIEDAPPTGTVYVADSAEGTVYDNSGYEVNDSDIIITVGSDNSIKWEINSLADEQTVIVAFQVEVTEAALTITDSTISNTAEGQIGENKYKTNKVSNPVPEEEEEDPVKDVVATNQSNYTYETADSIDGDKVSKGDVLTYVITYTVPDDETPGALTIVDEIPDGTTYRDGSADVQVVQQNGNSVEIIEDQKAACIDDGTAGTITWTLNDGDTNEIDLSAGDTVTVIFQVIVDDGTDVDVIENDADVTYGENTYKTNLVKNPVGDEGDPEKDVSNESGDSINHQNVSVGDILTYTITYTAEETGTLTIADAPPVGTTYVKGSAAGTVNAGTVDEVAIDSNSIVVSTDGDYNITWTVEVEEGDEVEVSFQVGVTEEALTVTDSTVENQADVKIGGGTYTTNIVKNPVPDVPRDEDFGKVIVNEDGSYSTDSTGAYGDTVDFDVSIDAVNSVDNDEGLDENNDGIIDTVQVAAYYIYDQLDKGLTLNVDSLALTIAETAYTVQNGSISEDTDQNPENASGVMTYTVYVYEAGDEKADYNPTLFIWNDENTGYTLIAVTIPWADKDGSALYGNGEIHLTYSATINTDAEIAGDGNYNRAIFDYSTVDSKDPYDPDPTQPYYPSGSDLNHWTYETRTKTYTYALGVQKVSSVTGETLEGAYFTAVDAGGNQLYAVPYMESGEAVDGVYEYTSNLDAEEATDTFVTNADGQIIIKGIDIGTYKLTETKAPKGYVLLTDPVTVTASMSSSSTTTTTFKSTSTRYFETVSEAEWNDIEEVYTRSGDEDSGYTFTLVEKPAEPADGYYKEVSSETKSSTSSTDTKYTFALSVITLLIENAPGSTLPTTGGIGTTIFYIVGTILVLGAVVVLITRRRMRSE